MARGYQEHVGCAARLECIVRAVNCTRADIKLLTDFIKFLLASRRKKHLVNLDECVCKCLLVILVLEVFILLELCNEVRLAEFGHFDASMAVKNRENRVPGFKVDCCNVAVLVIFPPSLHAGGTPREL